MHAAGLSQGCAKEGMQCLTNVGDKKNIVMDSPYFYQKLSEAMGNYSADYWVPYMRLHVIYNLSPLLDGAFSPLLVRNQKQTPVVFA